MKSPRNAVGGFGGNSKGKGILIFRKYTSIFLKPNIVLENASL